MRYTDDTRAVEFYTAPPRRGMHIQLVRWGMGWEGPEYVLVTGKYLGATDGEWQLDVGGRVESYPRDEWSVCSK